MLAVAVNTAFSQLTWILEMPSRCWRGKTGCCEKCGTVRRSYGGCLRVFGCLMHLSCLL